MKNKILKLIKELIKIKSYEWNKSELDKSLNFILKKIPKNLTIEEFEKDWVKSALVYNTKKRPEKFKILFNCHLDIIPWKSFQYIPEIKWDKLIWAGANDMKWNLVSALFAFIECANKVNYPLAIQLVTDEEIWGFKWTKYQVENWVNSDFIIATEPTNLDIVNKAKWVLWLKIISFWKTSHWAYPWRWENAIEKMNDFIFKLKKIIPNPNKSSWVTTLNISQIETKNKSFNKIPDECSIYLDVRYIPEDKKNILKKIKNSLPENFKIDIIVNEPSVFVEENNIYIKEILNSTQSITWNKHKLYWAQWTSDWRHFSNVWWKSIEFWAIWWWIWEDNEWVSISWLENYYKILYDFLLKIN